MKNLIFIFISAFLLSGCANFGKKMKAFLRGQPLKPKTVAKAKPKTTFSSQSNLAPPVRRDYKRMTKERLERGGEGEKERRKGGRQENGEEGGED